MFEGRHIVCSPEAEELASFGRLRQALLGPVGLQLDDEGLHDCTQNVVRTLTVLLLHGFVEALC